MRPISLARLGFFDSVLRVNIIGTKSSIKFVALLQIKNSQIMTMQFKGEYAWLSNFAPVEIEYEGRTYPSLEHAYQAARSIDPSWKDYCASGVSSGNVKRKSKNIIYSADWMEVRVAVMKELCIKKYADPDYKAKLLATGSLEIIEGNTWGDTFWGVDIRTGEGLNILGKIIMEIRSSLE